MEQMKDFAKVVNEQRKKKNMTQEELACRLGITPQAVSKWENGIGLPDVTLFPLIAEELDISIEALFGVEKKNTKKINFSKSFNGLPLIAEWGGKACYSDKTMVSNDEGKIAFSDGSEADMMHGSVINCGTGEVRIVKPDYIEDDVFLEDGGEDCFEKELEPFDSVDLTVSRSCDVQIHGHSKRACVYAKGKMRFIAAINIENVDGKLSVNIKNADSDRSGGEKGNKLDIYVPFEKGKKLNVTINGSSDILVQSSFEACQFKINGSGDISANTFDSLSVQINGSGDITVSEVTESVKVRICGSGDVSLGRAVNPDIKVMGSGDVLAKQVLGNMKLQILGSGDMECAGEVESLVLSVAGSGDVKAPKLTVRDANINIDGGSDVTIGRIIGRSVEKLGKNATLKVERRG